MQIPKIDVQDSRLPVLLSDMEKGVLQVPRFQRKFVWYISKTRALLDSIFKEFPIGTFFLWKAPPNTPNMFRTLDEIGIPEPKPGNEITYILDGQQRMTSLYSTINGISIGSRDYARICIDLKTATSYMNNEEEGFDEDIFVSKKPDNFQYVSIKDLVGEDHLLIYENVPSEWKPAFNKAHNSFQTYPLSVVWIREQNIADAINIFQRINQAGRRLSRYDLVCANVWRRDFDLRLQVEEINRQFDQRGFGKLHETIFSQSFALILKDQCLTVDELSLTTDEIKDNWEKIISSIKLAVQFVIDNFGVKRADYLPYRGILTVLAYYFYHAPSSALTADQRNLLWQWFWRVTLSERYSSTSPSRMAEDVKLLKKSFKGEIVPIKYPIKVTQETVSRTKMTSTSSALRNAVLCLLVLKTPKNFKDNSQINLSDEYFSILKKTERHHIFPIGYLKDLGLDSKVHLIPNFCFIPADLNKEIGKKDPATYMENYRSINPGFGSSIATHIINIGPDSALWTNEYNDFLDQRAELISQELTNLVELRPEDISVEPTSEEDQLRDHVNGIELLIRDFIEHRFSSVQGSSYWRDSIPTDIQGEVKNKIKDRLIRHPYESQAMYSSPRQRLDFCDVSDYSKIILKNWGVFGEVFQNKNEFTIHINSFRKLRNCVSHNRKPSDIESQMGNTGMTWLDRCIDSYYQDIQESEDDIEEIVEYS